MDHLTEAQIIELLEGQAPIGAEAHIAGCTPCASLLNLWEERIDVLREMSREPLDEAELHNLKVLFGELGPGRSPARRWVAKLVRSSATAPAAVRGSASGEILEYSSGPYSLMLRVGARRTRSTVSVVGQIVSADQARQIGGTFALTPTDGRVRLSDVDRFGEFNLSDVSPGRYRGTWWFGDQLLVVSGVEEIGTDDEP